MFERLLNLFSTNKSSGNVAKDRLQVLLKMDRESTSAIPEEIMEQLREELMQVINKYLEIEQESLDVKFERNTDSEGRVSTALVANIPIHKAKVKAKPEETTEEKKPKKETPKKTEKKPEEVEKPQEEEKIEE